MKPGGSQRVNLSASFIFGTMLNCPDKVKEVWEWQMSDLMDQHDADRPDCKLSAHARALLDDLESTIYGGETIVEVIYLWPG